MNKETLRTRTTAVIFVLSMLISLIFLVFAFIQKSEAEKQTQIAVQFKLEAEHQRLIASQSMTQAEKARQDLKACASR